jgi:5-formyltetrahydrofolate cyclo-ligase
VQEPGDLDRLRGEKQSLRKRILDARANLAEDERNTLSALICARVLALPELQRAHCVLAYLSFGNELSTEQLIRGLQASSIQLVLPRIDRARHRLELHRVQDVLADTKPGVWGIREPDPERCAPAELDEIELIVAPGVAFTPACDRLGYGGGYYDELLSRWKRAPLCAAPAFDLQLVPVLPLSTRDRPVDAVVTQSALYRR